MSDTPRFDTLGPQSATEQLEGLVACYLDVYRDGGEFHSEDRFRRQITGHMQGLRWEAITATDQDNDELVGYLYGFALPEETRWWDGLTTDVPEGFTNEDDGRTAVVSELLVRGPYRRHGIARALHEWFLANRTEQRVTLLVEPDNAPAYAAYRSWGYDKVAQLRPGWEHAPLFDVLVRLLN